MPHDKASNYTWKYTVAKRGNYQNGKYWDIFRIERSRWQGKIKITTAVCDVFGKRRIALAVAQALNKTQPIKAIR